MDRHKHLDTIDDNELQTDWQHNLNIGKPYSEGS